ncbi:MAG: DUF3301 domain-containing protein [Gallionella sp.]
MSLLFLILLAAFGWFWLNSIYALEIARKAGRRACDEAHVQFLDDTVAGTALALVRDITGRLAFRRTYRFEFSETGNTRLEGQLTLLGHRLESVTMEPYQMQPDGTKNNLAAPELPQPNQMHWPDCD